MYETDRNAIAQPEFIRLSQEDQLFFVEALVSPPEPGDALRRAQESHKQLIGPE